MELLFRNGLGIGFFLGVLIFFNLSCTTYRFDHLRVYEERGDDLALIEAFRGSKDAYIRAQAAQSLGRMLSKRGVSHLIVGLEDVDWVVRYYSAWSLGKIGDISALEFLEGRLELEEDLYVIQAIKGALEEFN